MDHRQSTVHTIGDGNLHHVQVVHVPVNTIVLHVRQAPIVDGVRVVVVEHVI